MALTSANSINIARWMPQMFYFLFAYKQLKSKNKPIVFSVPSGNFGNICAGMLAQKLGFPFAHFIASNNANNVVERYFKTNTYSPLPSIQTISNAMDVGNPSNFVRIQKLHRYFIRGVPVKLVKVPRLFLVESSAGIPISKQPLHDPGVLLVQLL